MKLNGFLKIMLAAVLITSGIGSFAHAEDAAPEKMTSETHTVVIVKLETALAKAVEDETVDLSPVRSRLADLYSERARLREMEEAKENCQTCKGASGDRKRALQLYSDVLKETPRENRGPLAIHMAHLNYLVNQPKQAEALFEMIIKEGAKTHSKDNLATAYIGRAESKFSRGQFDKAQRDFETALGLAQASKRGRISHRIAWCQLNQGDQETAVASLVSILKNPAYLKPVSTEGAVSDISFQEEIVRDLATFVARGNVDTKQMQLVEKYAPADAKLEIMRHFATELERLGQKSAALIAWSTVASLEPDKQGRLEVLVRVARIRYDRNEKLKSKESFAEAVAYWKKSGCEDQIECENLRKTLKNLVTDWHRAERKKPSANLLSVYTSYISKFEDDMEMTFHAATIANSLKLAQQGIELYHKSSLLAAAKPDAKILAESLAGEIEMAEMIKKGPESTAARESAYDHYLKMAPSGAMAHQVSYQRARLPYESGDNQRAADRLETYARSALCVGAKAAGRKLCLQAAELDIDARVQLKNDVQVEKSALAYAKFYPENKIEFLRIARTSAMKQSTSMSEDDALVKLAAIDTTGITADEKLRLIKTRMTLAEKVKDLPRLKSSANELLSLKNLSEKDRELGLSRLAWAAEMSFDFKSAYALNKKMKTPGLSTADRELRLAMFAELAGQSPRQHEEAFLRQSRSGLKRAVILAKIVRKSSNPAREFRRYQSELTTYADIGAPLALETYARSNDRGFAQKVLKTRKIANHSAGRALARQLFLQDFAKVDKSVASHRIATRSDARMQSTLKERIRLIGSVEGQANQAIRSRDWTAQLVTLATLSRENNRLYNDILTLPVPRQLKGQDRLNYIALIEQNANVYLAKHQAIEAKLAQFWKDSSAFEGLMKDYQASRPAVRKVLASELRAISKVAPSGLKDRVTKAAAQATEQPATSEVKTALKEAQEKPFNTDRLEVLRELQKGLGRETMVAYLDARMTTLKQEAKR